MKPTIITDADFAKIGASNQGVTSTSNGRQQYQDTQGNIYYRNETGVGTPQYSTSYEKVAAAPSSTVPIVTSAQSRSNYTTNVGTLQNAKSNMQTVQAGQTASGIAASLGITPEKFLELNPNFAAKGGKNDYAGMTGDIQPGQTYKIAPDGTPTKIDTSGTTNPDGTPKVNADGSSVNPDGSTNPTGTTGVTDPATGRTYAGIDPVLAKAYTDAQVNIDQQVTDAKATLDRAKETLANDPAAQGAIDSIKAKYDILIKQMQDKNAILLGSQKTNSIRSGSLQYANEMNSNFMSQEMDKATQRIADIITQETQMVLKAQQAYKEGDVKALDEATKAYDDVNKEKLDSITKLLDETDKAVKTQQADAKQQAATAKQQITDDIRVSTNIANTMADKIAESGVTDEKQIEDYIQAMASQSGISNLDVLRSAVSKAQAAKKKSDLAIDNTQSIIDKRNKPTTAGAKKATGGGKDGAYTYSGNDVSDATSLLNQGGTINSIYYAPRGDDTYVDPAAYLAVYNQWIKKGGTPAGFLKQFPVKNVNPDSRDKLPAGLTAK